ncbi:hypothetical protein BKI49_32315 [Streptomyces sp. Tue6028]|uniref:PAS domain-containing protein n=1 Tax=Streptomyces sp. Tue6028 TaxID=2036037 RepID=UPI000BB3829C|nr:PAS domain-containing protein [Streptomyces sp. Tue6028]PBC59704.1 hypothetical protein BKI49_32315 [Streptomyces sp. Tue6028]
MTEHGTTAEEPPPVPPGETDVVTATTDVRGRVTGWSEGARLLLGYRAEDVVGRSAVGLLAEDVGAVGAAMAGRRSWTGHVALWHRDGRRVEGELLAIAGCCGAAATGSSCGGTPGGPRPPGNGIPVPHIWTMPSFV